MITLAMTNGTTDYNAMIEDCNDLAAAAVEAWPYARDYAGTCKYRAYDEDGNLIAEGTF